MLNLHSQPRAEGPTLGFGGIPVGIVALRTAWFDQRWCVGKWMPGRGTGTFIDPDDYQASLRQVRINLVVSAHQGAFNARLTWATLHHLQLLHGEEDMPRIAYVSLPTGLVFVGFVTRPGPPMLGGAELQTGDIIFHSRGERFHQQTTGPCGWSLVGLAPEHLERYDGALSRKALSLPAAALILRPAARNAARLRRLHAQACRLAETRPKVLAQPEVAP